MVTGIPSEEPYHILKSRSQIRKTTTKPLQAPTRGHQESRQVIRSQDVTSIAYFYGRVEGSSNNHVINKTGGGIAIKDATEAGLWLL